MLLFLLFKKRDKDFWQQFEEKINDKIPPCMVNILRENGYNSYISVSEINSECIAEMEEYTKDNLTDLIKDFNCCNGETYRNQTNFRFLPGHRRLLLALAQKANMIKDEKKNKKRPKTPVPSKEHYTLPKTTDLSSTLISTNQPSTSNNNNVMDNNNLSLQHQSNSLKSSVQTIESRVEETESDSPSPTADQLTSENVVEETDLSEENVANDEWIQTKLDELVVKLSAAAKNNKIDCMTSLNSNSISNAEAVVEPDNSIKLSCYVECPMCGKMLVCKTKKNHWQTSNIMKHFKAHGCSVSIVRLGQTNEYEQNK